MNKLISFLIAGVAALVATPAMSANFTTLCDDPVVEIARKSCSIKLSGIIEKGDAQKLLQLVRKPQQPGWSYGYLVVKRQEVVS